MLQSGGHCCFTILDVTAAMLPLHVLVALVTILVVVALTTPEHMLVHLLALLAVSVAHSLLAGPNFLSCIIHFYGASKEKLAIHFLQSSLRLFF